MVGNNDESKKVDEQNKILTFQIKFVGNLKEEFEVRKAIENYVLALKLNVFGFKARVLSRKEVEQFK